MMPRNRPPRTRPPRTRRREGPGGTGGPCRDEGDQETEHGRPAESMRGALPSGRGTGHRVDVPCAAVDEGGVMDDETPLAFSASAFPTRLRSRAPGRPRSRRTSGSAGVLGSALLTIAAEGLPAHAAHVVPPRPVIRVDADRDGLVTPADGAGKGAWSQDRGALMLPDVDDDQRRCPTAEPGGERLPDERLAGCVDSSDACAAPRTRGVTWWIPVRRSCLCRPSRPGCAR